MENYSRIYSSPINGSVFVGAGRRQRGGGFFNRIARFAIPILKDIGSSIGKEALNFASNTINDINKGKPLRETLKNRGINSLINASNDVLNKQRKKRRYNFN